MLQLYIRLQAGVFVYTLPVSHLIAGQYMASARVNDAAPVVVRLVK
jgi:hypothetical protein